MSLVPVQYLPATLEETGRPSWVELMQPAADLAAQIAGTDFVPEAFRRNPAAVAACIMYGAEIGIGPMQSLAKIDIVKGRPAPRAELGRALLLAAGHSMWTDEQTNSKVTVSGHRRGEQNKVMTVSWTMDDVKKAGISNQNYAKYPRQMLYARASIELVRQVAPDALGGITLFAEEAADITDADMPVIAATTEKPKTTRQRKVVEAVEDVAGDPPEPEPDKPSAAQTKMAMALFTECGITDRDDRLHATSAFVGHTVGSWNDLTRDEGSAVIDGLERLKAGTITFALGGDEWTVVQVEDEFA